MTLTDIDAIASVEYPWTLRGKDAGLATVFNTVVCWS